MPAEAAPAPGPERASGGRATPPSDTKLARLLETETRLERMLSEVRREAERLIDEARAEARERRGAIEARLDGEAEALRRRIDQDAEGEIESIREEAAKRARRFREAPDRTIDDLAAFVLGRVVSKDGSGA